jgi:uncharacterized LabA/DUF88 family protein
MEKRTKGPEEVKFIFGRTAIFIDGDNFNGAIETLKRELGFKHVDYIEKLPRLLSRGTLLLRSFYYCGERKEGEPGHEEQQKFLMMLKRNGYRVITKEFKEQYDKKGRKRRKANLDIELAVDMVTIADHVDRIVLVSGDGDFTKIIDAVGMKGVRTCVVSLWRAPEKGGNTSPELREAADEFINLEDIIKEIVEI